MVFENRILFRLRSSGPYLRALILVYDETWEMIMIFSLFLELFNFIDFQDRDVKI